MRRLLPAAARGSFRALERTNVSRKFTEPAPFGALYARSRPLDAVRRRGPGSGQVQPPRLRPDGTAGPVTEVSLLPNPDGDVSRTWRDTCISPSWTLPHRSGSPPKTFSIFFSKGICFRACVIKPEFYLLLNSPSVFFLTVSPTFWTEDRLCFLVKCWCTLRIF